MKLLDYVAVAFSVALVTVISTTVYGGDGRTTVQITAPDVEYLFAPSVEETVTVHGPIGETVVRIENGRAHVVGSHCDLKICLRTGQIEQPGSWIACLPNRVFVSINSGQREGIDGHSY